MNITTEDIVDSSNITAQVCIIGAGAGGIGCAFRLVKKGISVVIVDKNGEPIRNAFSYMDQRAREELKKGVAHGIQIAGASIPILLKSLMITGAVAASVKDPVWKYKWVEKHEPG